MTLDKALEKDTKPWWKYGYLWLVISGPAVVVVAGFYTLWLAIDSPNIILTDEKNRAGTEASQSAEGSDKVQDAINVLMPAVKGRNHAATPIVDRPVD